MANRANDWFRQAQDDLKWAKDTFSAGRWAQVCFISQQVAEKSLKAYALSLEYDQIRSHSITQICKALKINGELEKLGKKLDLYYISSRYPDAFPEGAPFEYFTEEQAEDAVKSAEFIHAFVQEKAALK
ncbi:MAG TPA: DNA-binding protein [Spirochaeta sp.]|nr:DNA-binding protein [Spirochaeta sp.]